MKTNIGTMLFNLLDSKGNGYISKETSNLKLFLQYSQLKVNVNDPNIQQQKFKNEIDNKVYVFVQDLDKNNDQRISLVEFLLWFRKHMHEILPTSDTN